MKKNREKDLCQAPKKVHYLTFPVDKPLDNI